MSLCLKLPSGRRWYATGVTSRGHNISISISHISVVYQSYISHISLIYQSYIIRISFIYQSYISQISVPYQSYIISIVCFCVRAVSRKTHIYFIKKTRLLYWIWNEKTNLMWIAASLNTFSSSYFVWLDIGAIRWMGGMMM